jgi:hypothetical protein
MITPTSLSRRILSENKNRPPIKVYKGNTVAIGITWEIIPYVVNAIRNSWWIDMYPVTIAQINMMRSKAKLLIASLLQGSFRSMAALPKRDQFPIKSWWQKRRQKGKFSGDRSFLWEMTFPLFTPNESLPEGRGRGLFYRTWFFYLVVRWGAKRGFRCGEAMR